MKYHKILVVDDIKKNIQVLGSVLGKEGYAVSYATDGPKALDMVSQEKFDRLLNEIIEQIEIKKLEYQRS